jgi:hypothetical protein
MFCFAITSQPERCTILSQTDIVLILVSPPASSIVHILVKHINIELLAHVLVASNLCSQLRFSPRVVLTSEECAIYFSSFFALIPNWESITVKVSLQRIDSFILRQISSHALEERYAEALVRSREYAMCRRFAYAVCYHFKALPDIDNKCAGNIGYINPLAAFVKCLESFYPRWRGLKQECPPS